MGLRPLVRRKVGSAAGWVLLPLIVGIVPLNRRPGMTLRAYPAEVSGRQGKG